MSSVTAERFATIDRIEDLIDAIGEHACTPGWIPRQCPILWDRPQSRMQPMHWNYRMIQPALQAAGRLIGTDLAERRNFVLRNPVRGNEFATTTTLVGAYQSILPGERARSHRHAPHALRVILDAQGAYSIVNGQKHPMDTGDIVLTPGGCWHGHVHEGTEQAYWFDCLDVPLVQLLEPMTHDPHPDAWETAANTVKRSPYLFRWADTIHRLGLLQGRGDPHFGRVLDLSSDEMPTITIQVHDWKAGWVNRPFRHTSNTLYVVLQGSGHSEIGELSVDWQFGDVMAAPLWCRQAHVAHQDAVIIALSDLNLMKHARYYRLEDSA
ncbi:MAG TPA: cupin domain-containing protein [Burkholderiaceae bacterium]|nr:cupin domain-containing protein [Burkholderiaceae bacterium]